MTSPKMSIPKTRTKRSRFKFLPPCLLKVFKVSLILTFLPALTSGLHPPQCQWSVYQDIERLNCVSDPGSSLIVEDEVYGIGPEHAKSLTVECISSPEDDPGSSKSGHVLSHGVFMSVANLRSLTLENCRITGITPGALSYLPYLQNLTLHAGTSLTWPTAFSLDIKSGVLTGLRDLRYLDLSTTSLNSLPQDFLCLPSLLHLNLSSCFLRDFRSIGILPLDPTNPQNCPNHIRVLDLSLNHFSLLPPATFASVTELEELTLDLNSITIAAERALLGLTQLKIISLAGNQLTSLPPEFFKDNRGLKEIHLQNNSLSVIAPGLFSGLEHLVVLDLSYNELTTEWVNGETFRGLVRLIVLNLAHNDLTKVDPILFRDLSSLQVLNLESNKISQISDTAFSGMYNLHTLLVSHNDLKIIDPFICNGLFVLSFLALDNNNIASVASNSFQNCSNLIDLNLSGNKLENIPQALSSLNLLKTLDLGENKIFDIRNASYQHLGSLYGLRLTDNLIETVPASAFSDLPSLKIINLAKNNITSVDPGAFDNSPNLQAVRLDTNKLKDIAGLFRNIPNLLWLNISGNNLEHLEYSNFPPRLQWLDLRANQIRTLGSCLDVEKQLRLRNLDLSHNALQEISSSNLPDSIENLILSENQIHTILPYTFFRKPNLTRVDLSFNHLTKIDQNALRLSPDKSPPSEILLGHNPLTCDCTMQWLQNMNHEVGHYPVIQDSEHVKCSLTFDRNLAPTSYLTITSTQFLCKYESHCFSACSCCDFDACDCEMTCPLNCSCYHDQGWSNNLVDCSGHGQRTIPKIPMDVTELYLDGNFFPSLDSHAFIGRKNLRSLFLNGSHIEVIQNRTFHGLGQLKILHLENNFLERLEGFEFQELESLQELYLQQNSITWVNNMTFADLGQLRVINLHGNNFFNFRIWEVLQPAPNLQQVTLHANEFTCECLFTIAFKEWLEVNQAKIFDLSQIKCIDQKNSSGLIVVKIFEERNPKCSQSTDLSVREVQKGHEDYLWVIVTVLVVLTLLTLVCVVGFYWRQSLKVWVHARCGLRLGTCSEAPTERDKLFDAFVSYSSKDEAWVRQVLAAELERHDPPYRLCLRYRDLPTGGTYLADTIVQASEASKRTVLVLSHHFLKGEWSRTDVKSAHHSVLKDRNRKVIIILLGDLPSKDLDPDIRLYLKNHTYLNCEDKRFWPKLRFALPDVKTKLPLSRGVHGRMSNPHPHQHHNGGGVINMRSSQGPPPPPPPTQVIHHHNHSPPPPAPSHPLNPPNPHYHPLNSNPPTPLNNLNAGHGNNGSGRRPQRAPNLANNGNPQNRHVAIHI